MKDFDRNPRHDQEAAAVGAKIVGLSPAGADRRIYECLACGFHQTKYVSSVRGGSFNCDACILRKEEINAPSLGIRVVGNYGMDGRITECLVCGHLDSYYRKRDIRDGYARRCVGCDDPSKVNVDITKVHGYFGCGGNDGVLEIAHITEYNQTIINKKENQMVIGISEKQAIVMEHLGSIRLLKALFSENGINEQVAGFIENMQTATREIRADEVELLASEAIAVISKKNSENQTEATRQLSRDAALAAIAALQAEFGIAPNATPAATVKKATSAPRATKGEASRYAFWVTDNDENGNLIPVIGFASKQGGKCGDNEFQKEHEKRGKAVNPSFTRSMCMVADHPANEGFTSGKAKMLTEEEFRASPYFV